jgi:hypothetical protein
MAAQKIDWKLELDGGIGSSAKALRSSMCRAVSSLNADQLPLLHKFLTQLLTLDQPHAQERVLGRYKRRADEDRLFGPSLLQERLVKDLFVHSPVWKALGISTPERWRHWCSHFHDLIGADIRSHLLQIFDPSASYIVSAEVGVVKLLLDAQTPSAPAYSYGYELNLESGTFASESLKAQYRERLQRITKTILSTTRTELEPLTLP